MPQPVSFWTAFRYWLKLGFISFGGPAGQIAVMHQELVEQKHWVSERRFLHALNYCMLLPGPEAQQLAVYLGWLMHRTWGGIAAGVLFVLPSFFILALLSWLYLAYGQVAAIAGVLYGIKPAVTAIVAAAAWRIGARTLRSWVLAATALAAFLAIALFKLPFPAIILGAAVIGIAGSRLAPAKFFPRVEEQSHRPIYGPALIDDHSPTPPHARFSKQRVFKILAVGLCLWLAGIGALLALGPWQGPLVQMGVFFTKAALLTFGGAYAVLPYVYQGAVMHFHWLDATQMIDGLALGETTPGPLIMVVAFVGFVGGWNTHPLSSDAILAGALLGSLVATYFTFLPSFLLILLGGPFVESTHGKLQFTAPLTAITSAVVGVIANLAVFFAYHVLWPHGWARGVDWISAVIGLAAFVALVHLRLGVVTVIVCCGLVGLACRLLA